MCSGCLYQVLQHALVRGQTPEFHQIFKFYSAWDKDKSGNVENLPDRHSYRDFPQMVNDPLN